MLEILNLFEKIRRFTYGNVYLLVISAWLLTFSFIIDNYWSTGSSVNSVRNKVSSYLHKQERDAESILKNHKLVESLIRNDYSDKVLTSLVQKKFYLFIYSQNDTSSESLLFWNTQNVTPQSFMIYGKQDQGFVKLDNGYYVWKRIPLTSGNSIVLFPIKWSYFIQNKYLKNDFIIDPSISDQYDITDKYIASGVVKSGDGKSLFSIYPINQQSYHENNFLAAVLKLLSILVFLYFIHLMASSLANSSGKWLGVVVLVFCLGAVRWITVFFDFPFHWKAFSIFNPELISFGFFSPSLGDLLVNAMLLLWILLFVRKMMNDLKLTVLGDSNWRKWFLLFVLSISLVWSGFWVGNLIRQLVLDSHFSFDVIDFFSLKQYSIIGLVTLCILSLTYFFFSQVIFKLIRLVINPSFFITLVSFAISGLLILSFNIGKMNAGFDFFILFWLLLFFSFSSIPHLSVLNQSIATYRLVFWLVFFSSSITIVINSENRKKEIEERKKYAGVLALKSDPANESLVNSMLTDLTVEFLSDNFYRFNSMASSSAFKDSIISSNTSRYNNKYSTHIYVFSNSEQPIFNEDSSTYNELNSIWVTQAKPTSFSGLNYFDQSYDLFSYICKKEVVDEKGENKGNVFILATPKEQRRDALYPELFSKGQESSIENSPVYSFALYNNYKLTKSHNDYPFPSHISPEDLKAIEYRFTETLDHDELWYNAGAGNIVAIARNRNVLMESITLFSYLFFVYLIIGILLWLAAVFLNSNEGMRRFFDFLRLSLRQQIYGSMMFISIIKFLIIAVASVLFFNYRYEANNREKLNRTIRAVEKEVKNNFTGKWLLADTAEYVPFGLQNNLELTIQELSDIHGVDINLYDLEGNLKVSSLPLPYKKGILSTKMNPVAYYHLKANREIQFIQKENIGDLTYLSNYLPVLDANGNDYAYVNIPYFISQNILKQEISNFLVTIINLYAFIFLLAGIFSFLITERIGKTLSLIADKMKKISIGGRNEPLQWNRKDEIGELIGQYNMMVVKLEESAAILAQTEREGAWREMARQVAHEIKNPLTPMKLSMQFLQKSIDNKSPNIEQLARQVSITLIEQIEHLSNIANAFSQFASIGEPQKEYFNVNEVISNILTMHQTNDDIHLHQHLLNESLIVYADRTQIHRLFTNILLNAIQSVPVGMTPEIEIYQYKEDPFICIAIKDNGNGIDDATAEKIFTPNFTTKSSGTGLGLAMCKRIAEQSEGDILFETILNEGTVFTVKLPLVV